MPKATPSTAPETAALEGLTPEAVETVVKTAVINEVIAENKAEDAEAQRKLALLATLTQQSSTITWENVGTNGVDGEMYVQLRITPAAYELLRSVVVTLRTEFQNAQ